MINNGGEVDLVIKKKKKRRLQNPPSSRCKTNLYSHSILDLYTSALAGHVLAKQFLIRRTLQDSEDVPNYRARVKHTEAHFTPAGLRTQKHQAGASFIAVAKAEVKSVEEVLNQSHSPRGSQWGGGCRQQEVGLSRSITNPQGTALMKFDGSLCLASP